MNLIVVLVLSADAATKTFFFSAVQEKSGCPRLERLDLR
jgi:hypothetical protein